MTGTHYKLLTLFSALLLTGFYVAARLARPALGGPAAPAASTSDDSSSKAARAPRRRVAVFAAVEFTPRAGDVRANRAALEALVRDAAQNGAEFIVLPEYALTGPLTELSLAPARQRAFAAQVWSESVESFGRLAQSLGVWLALPVLEEDAAKEQFFITTVLLDPSGQAASKSRKLVPRMQLGDGYAAKGDEKLLQSVETPFGRIGFLSGDDLARGVPRLAYVGARTILVSASWRTTDGSPWTEAALGLAGEHKVNLVISNLKAAGGAAEAGAVITKDGKLAAKGEAAGGDRVLYGALAREGQPLEVELPLGLPSVPQPAARPLTAESVEVGRKLFFDARLSSDGSVSCATCHEPSKAFADNLKVAEGVFGRKGKKNTPTVLNSAYKPFLSWEGNVESLERQVLHATNGWPEMSLRADQIIAYLEESPEYRAAFRAAGVEGRITFEDAAGCIADFIRTLVAGDSAFDRYYFAGERGAIPEAARRGFELFKTKANCATCHQLKEGYALFMDGGFHNTGVGYHPRFDYLGYSGDGLEGNLATKNSFRGEYATPSLRDVALTAPYMHDGSLPTLEEVVRFYDRGGTKNPFIDPLMKPLGLTPREQSDLVEFLRTLTSGRGPRVGTPAVAARHN